MPDTHSPIAPRWQRVCASLLRITGVIGGVLILGLAAARSHQSGEIPWDLTLIGIGYPVLMGYLARLLVRTQQWP
jgi:hypothetical protein